MEVAIITFRVHLQMDKEFIMNIGCYLEDKYKLLNMVWTRVGVGGRKCFTCSTFVHYNYLHNTN
jgi:hypothetical protein